MAIEIQINTELDNSKTAKEFSNIEKQVKKTSKTLGDLQKRQERLNKVFEGSRFGTRRFEESRDALRQVTKEIKNLELSVEALDTDQVASEISGLVGGFTDVATGAILAFGISQESAEEFLKTFAQVEGAGRLIKGSIEGVQAATKLYNSTLKESALFLKVQTIGTTLLGAAQAGYNLVVGASTGLMKLFRIALASTGIGLLIVGIGLLVANFDAVKDSIINVIKFAFKPYIFLFDLIIDGLQALGIIESDAAKASRKASEERAKALSKAAEAAEEKNAAEKR